MMAGSAIRFLAGGSESLLSNPWYQHAMITPATPTKQLLIARVKANQARKELLSVLVCASLGRSRHASLARQMATARKSPKARAPKFGGQDTQRWVEFSVVCLPLWKK